MGVGALPPENFRNLTLKYVQLCTLRKVTKFLWRCLRQRIFENYSFGTNVSNLVRETVAGTVAATVAESVAATVSAKHQHVRYTALSSPQPAGRRFPRIFTARCFFVKHMGTNFHQKLGQGTVKGPNWSQIMTFNERFVLQMLFRSRPKQTHCFNATVSKYNI